MAANVLQTVIELSLASFYIFVLFVIATSKVEVFRSAFFVMFVATGIADVTSLLSNVLLRLNREFGLGEEFQYIVLYLACASGVSFVAHMLGNMFITVNRYAAICLMQRYDTLWMRKNVWTAIGIQYVVSICCSVYVLTTKLVYIHNDDGTTILKGYEQHVDLLIRCTYIGACAIYSVVSVTLNARMLIEWHRLSKVNDFLTNRNHERRLLLYTLLVFVFTMLSCSQQFIRGIASLGNNDVLYLWASKQFYWINDAMLSIPPLSLTLLSSELRQSIIHLFERRKLERGAAAAVAVFSTRSSTVQIK